MTSGVRTGMGALVALGALLLGGCGSESSTDDQAGVEPTGSAEPSESPEPTDEPTEAFVPGNPSNEVRPATDAEADWPACSEIWSEGGTIPADYEGCVDGSDVVVADLITCSFGGTMTTFDDRFHGVLGNVVNDAGEPLAESRAYARAYRLCSA